MGVSYWFESRELNVSVLIRDNKVVVVSYNKPSKKAFDQQEFDELSAQNLPDGAVWEGSLPGTFAKKDGVKVLFKDCPIRQHDNKIRLFDGATNRIGESNEPK